ncbi:phosphopantetheine adenylyltransferase [Acidovorax sp. ACV01]|uniref:phosphopantetheine adenylyltransferase n=1 Tax=Acidovorax sp. ACV01 TaxID=2769311 RepID=UPI001CE14E66|nr:phosphopantetheine adenylyltransferase [Acidovorax sp. ACV01]
MAARIAMTCQVIDGRAPCAYKRRIATRGFGMRHVVPVVLVLVAVVHALPLVGVLGAGKLAQLYGTPVQDAGVELLLRHRAVLFGLLAAFMGYAATRAELHRLALVAGQVSVVSFLLLSWLQRGSGLSAPLVMVVRVDGVALALLVVALAVHLRRSH